MTVTIPMPEPAAPPAPATRVAIARFLDRRRAEEAVARITRDRVPAKAVDLTATGLRPVSPPTSSSNYWDAAMDGLRLGAILGAIFAGVWSLAGLSGGSAGVVGFMLGALVGGLFGAAVAIVGHWGEKDPARAEDVFEADEYHVLVDERHEQAARAALRPEPRDGHGRFARGRSSRA